MRDLYIALSRSDPQMVTFVTNWLKKDPKNPKAQIARAWSIYGAAEFVASGRNRFSSEVSQAMYAEVDDLAYQAYMADPDLIPASDAMVRGFANRKDGYFALTTLDKVQSSRPNWGTVLRSINEASNLSANLTRKYCSSVVENFPADDVKKMNHRCLVTAAALYGRKGLRAYVEQHLLDDTDPALTVERLRYFVTRYEFTDATDGQIEWAKTVFLTHPVDQFELVNLAFLAARFESNLLFQHGISERFTDTFAKTRLAMAEEYLRHDPYNLDLIDMVEGVAFAQDFETFVDADGKTTHKSIPRNQTPEQRRAIQAKQEAQRADFKLRRLWASPYNADFWLDYAQFASQRDRPLSLFDGDVALQNAVIYSDDPAKALRRIISEIYTQYQIFTQFDDLADLQLSRMPQWQSLRRETNVATKMLCPYLRARLLHKEVCEYYPDSAGQCRNFDGDSAAESEKLFEAAKNTPECAGLLTATIEELWYAENKFNDAIVSSN
jgi:hypothetical protein